MIAPLVKEGSGVVAQNADAATHHPLPLLPLRRGAIFMADLFWKPGVRPQLTTKNRGPERQLRATLASD